MNIQVNIVSKDNAEFCVPVPEGLALSIRIVKDMIEELQINGNEPIDIHVPDVEDQKVLNLLGEYMKNDKESPINEEIKSGQKVPFSDWETAFFSKIESGDEQSYLFRLITICNYLNYTRLLHTACQKVANMIEGKTPEQIRLTFNLPDDLTQEEKERLYKENGLRPAFSELPATSS